jgi:hypothetical protein
MMRNALMLLIVLPLSAIAQPALSSKHETKEILDNYKLSAQHLNLTFRCRPSELTSDFSSINMITRHSFDTLFKVLLSNVFVGNNDLVQSTTAAAFTQDAEKGTLNINYSFFTSESRSSLYNIGVFSKSTDGIFGIYTSQAWSSEIGLNLGKTWIWGKTRFFDPPDCDTLRFKRTAYLREQWKKYDTLLHKNQKKIKEEIKEKRQLIEKALTDFEAKHDYNSLQKELRELDSIDRRLEQITPDPSQTADYNFYKNVLERDVAKFENENAIMTGYKLWWVQANAALSNNKITTKTDSLPAVVKTSFIARNTVKLLLGIGLHRVRDTKFTFQYFHFGFDLGLRNYLDHPSVKDPFLKQDTVSGTVYVFNKNQQMLKSYDLVRANLKTFEPSAYYSCFFLAKKTIGWDMSFRSRVVIDRPKGFAKEDYRNTYSWVTGPVFRIKKDEAVSKGTIGVEAGIMDALAKENAWDFFGARLKVGIPINALFK